MNATECTLGARCCDRFRRKRSAGRIMEFAVHLFLDAAVAVALVTVLVWALLSRDAGEALTRTATEMLRSLLCGLSDEQLGTVISVLDLDRAVPMSLKRQIQVPTLRHLLVPTTYNVTRASNALLLVLFVLAFVIAVMLLLTVLYYHMQASDSGPIGHVFVQAAVLLALVAAAELTFYFVVVRKYNVLLPKDFQSLIYKMMHEQCNITVTGNAATSNAATSAA